MKLILRKLTDTHTKGYLTLTLSDLRAIISVFCEMKTDTWYIRSIIKQNAVCKIITVKLSQSGLTLLLWVSSSQNKSFSPALLSEYFTNPHCLPHTLLMSFFLKLSLFSFNCFEDRNQHLVSLESPAGPSTASVCDAYLVELNFDY